ncbi:MAG: pentapeptide repeat-containing protein [Prochlorotrichaceae cyanobacterium]
MAKNYSGQDLRNANFRNQNLAGANFRGANLAGADFSGANLRGARFDSMRDRSSDRSPVSAGKSSQTLGASPEKPGISNTRPGLTNLKGANLSHAQLHSANFARADLTGANLTEAKAGLQRRWWITQIVLALILSGVFSFIGLFLSVGFTAYFFSSEITQDYGLWLGIPLVALQIGMVLAIAIQGFRFEVLRTIGILIAVAGAGAFMGLSLYITWRVFKGDAKFFVIRSAALAVASWGGTNFHRANLTAVDFQGATLKSCNFYKATLTRANFRHTEKLNRARPGDSLLQNWAVLDLLVSGQGSGLDLTKADLRGANLVGANLAGANLKQADLSEATLAGADLQAVNLREAACVRTDFRGACLTGACLEAWNIDTTTQVEGVEAQHVFLLEQPNQRGDRERRPHDPQRDFAPGDFEKYFKQVLDAMQLLIRDGINPEAFRAAFQTLMEKHGITPEQITGMEKKGNDVMLTVEVPTNANKAQIEADFHGSYQRQLEASAARIAQLEAVNDELSQQLVTTQRDLIQELRQSRQDVMATADKVTHNLGNLLANLTVVGSQSIEATDSVVNTGKLEMEDSTLNTGSVNPP